MSNEITRTEAVLEKLEEASSRQSSEIHDLAKAIRENTETLVRSFTKLTSIMEKGGPPSQGVNTVSVVGVLALIAGVYAMVQPMKQVQQHNTSEIGVIRERMAVDDAREQSDAGKLASHWARISALEREVYGSCNLGKP